MSREICPTRRRSVSIVVFKKRAAQTSTHLQVDGEDQRRGGDHGEGLVVGRSLAILPHGLQEGSVWDEEDYERDKDAVEQTDEEVLVVEQRPLLPGDVEFGKLQAEFVVHVLPREEGALRLLPAA